MKKPYFCFMVIGILIGVTLIFGLPGQNCVLASRANKNSKLLNIQEKGFTLYQRYCAVCHGPDGKGYMADEASALSNQDYLVSASDEYIIQGILRGRPGTAMSAWGKDKGGIFTKEDAEAILAFFRTWQTEPSVDLNDATSNNNTENKGNAENGGKIFEQWCSACHGKYGIGGKAIKLNNPVFLDTASNGYIRYAIENGRQNTRMTAYKNTLSATDIDDVISYIRTFNTSNAFKETVAVDNEELSEMIRKKGILNPGNPPANFDLIENRYVAADDVYAAYKASLSFIIIDARPPSDYLRSHITGAISIPFYDIENAVGLLPKDIWIITYCVCPHALSGKAADTLRAADYYKIAILNEGFFFWADQGYPSESGINSQLQNN